MSTTVREATDEEITTLTEILDAYEPVIEIRVINARSTTLVTEVWPIITVASL